MDTQFPHLYTYEHLAELPGRETLPHFYYPGALREGGRDGMIIQINPTNGDSWLGTFAFGQFGSAGVTGIFTTPDPQKFCVVAKGRAYVVSANTPASWELVQAQPVTDVRQLIAKETIIFVDHTRVTAYGPSGIKWRTGRLSWDDLKITAVTETAILCQFCDPLNADKLTNVEVDLGTGKQTGGLPSSKM